MTTIWLALLDVYIISVIINLLMTLAMLFNKAFVDDVMKWQATFYDDYKYETGKAINFMRNHKTLVLSWAFFTGCLTSIFYTDALFDWIIERIKRNC